MLTALFIKHFTIVESLELEFEQGMVALTGETGAGKSILLDALALALGGRGDNSVIRSGKEQCDISACFDIATNPEAKAWLYDHQLELSHSELILRRVINQKGRSKSYINGQPFPLNKTRELGETLVHIHGQHHQQHLLKPENHRIQLDAYGIDESLLKEVYGCFKQYQKILNTINELKHNFQSDRRELIAYQVEELDTINLTEKEVQHLTLEHKKLSGTDFYLSATNKALQLLDNDSSDNITNLLSQVMHTIEQLPEEAQIKNACYLVNEALIQCNEAKTELEDFYHSLEVEPERLHQVEERLSSIFKLARKHHIKAEELYHHYQNLKEMLDAFDAKKEKLHSLEKELANALDGYQQKALYLSTERKRIAQLLATEISETITHLGMPEGKVTIDITKHDSIKPNGFDKVEFLVAPNPGLGAKPLAKIASGGELSRISLAIQVLTAEKKAYPTLIFDEVDTGISGATAAIVGNLLRRLGKHTQVFCITHQAQVASSAHYHYKVEKNVRNQQTFSKIKRLNEQQKVDEIARMIGGVTITEQTKAHAKELLNAV